MNPEFPWEIAAFIVAVIVFIVSGARKYRRTDSAAQFGNFQYYNTSSQPVLLEE